MEAANVGADPDLGPAQDHDPTRKVIGTEEEEIGVAVTEEIGTEAIEIATGIDVEIVPGVETVIVGEGTVGAMTAREDVENRLVITVLKGMEANNVASVANMKNLKVQGDHKVVKRVKKNRNMTQILKRLSNLLK